MIYLPSKPLTLLILLTLTVSCGSTEETTRTEWEQVASLLPERPGTNIIVISFDALRADALGLYGYSKPTTPRIDQFSESTLVFDRAYTVAPVTPTSFASAFTGLLPSRVFHAWDLVWTDTLASRFSSAGYRTAGFMNNLQLSTQRHFDTGFDDYTVYRSQAMTRSSTTPLIGSRRNRATRSSPGYTFFRLTPPTIDATWPPISTIPITKGSSRKPHEGPLTPKIRGR